MIYSPEAAMPTTTCLHNLCRQPQGLLSCPSHCQYIRKSSSVPHLSLQWVLTEILGVNTFRESKFVGRCKLIFIEVDTQNAPGTLHPMVSTNSTPSGTKMEQVEPGSALAVFTVALYHHRQGGLYPKGPQDQC